MFGKMLRKARTRAGLTQKQVADKTDTSSQHISKMERGEKGCSLDTLRRLDGVLHFPQHDLLRLIRTPTATDPCHDGPAPHEGTRAS
jgi:transcriptional regulator with XRE-family HTH domain